MSLKSRTELEYGLTGPEITPEMSARFSGSLASGGTGPFPRNNRAIPVPAIRGFGGVSRTSRPIMVVKRKARAAFNRWSVI